MLSLHIHSYYSKLEGTLSPYQIVDFAKQQGMRSVCLTDTNCMNGLIQFAKYAEENNIKPILGTLITEEENENISALFLAKNKAGYSEICKIITTRNLQDEFSLLDVIQKRSKNLYIITSSLELLETLNENNICIPDLFVELIVTEKLKHHTRKLYEFSVEHKLKIVATHPAYFLTPEDFLLHKTVCAIRLNSTLDNLDLTEHKDEEFYLKESNEIKKVWKNLPQALHNAEEIAKNCNVNLEFGKYKFPVFSLPENETPYSYLWKICFDGLAQKYQPITENAVKRLQYELEVIDDLGFCDYFLVVWDIIREARARSMMTIGRGSAANSLVAYCLDLTQIDPIEHNLYFERFLNRGRLSPPDIDLDFSWKERDEIVKYVFEKYGYDKVAMISTTVTFRARSAFRETAKVFGLSDREISKFSKLIPWTSAKNLPEIAKKFPESRSLKFDEEPWKSIIKIASQLSGFPRHLSIHPGGIVITQTPITNFVALEYAKNKGLGVIITQPDMYPIEDYGLIKIDLLSQRSLGVLKDTVNILSAEKSISSNKKVPKIFSIKRN